MKSRQNLALMNILVSEWPVRGSNVPQVSVKPRIGLTLSISEPHVISWKAGLMGTEKREDTKWPEEKAIKGVYTLPQPRFLPGLPFSLQTRKQGFQRHASMAGIAGAWPFQLQIKNVAHSACSSIERVSFSALAHALLPSNRSSLNLLT